MQFVALTNNLVLGLRRLACVFLLALASAGALADDKLLFGNPDYFCRNGAFPGGGEYEGSRPVFSLARMTATRGAAKVYFSMDYGGVVKGCPTTQGQLCLSRKYVIPGDQVIVSKTLRGLACSWFERRHNHETVGWLPLSNMETLPFPEHPAIDRWLGKWRNGDNTITVTDGSQGSALRVAGEAYWPGRNAPFVHSGGIKAHGSPEGNVVKLEDDAGFGPKMDCGVRLSLVGRFLVASDNHQCGGMNVSFDGVYLKQKSGL